MHFGKGPVGWKRSDKKIREEVCQALTEDREVDASEIEVTVNEGVVTLSGNVFNRFTKRMAEECAEHVSGVQDVQNQLQIL